MLIRFLVFFFCFYFLATKVVADDSSQAWTIINFDLPLLTKQPQYRLYLEVQPRYNFSRNHLERQLFNSAIGYRLSPDLFFYTGYLWTAPSLPDNNLKRLDEHRLWQQVQYIQRFSDSQLGHRLRLEERKFEDIDDLSYRLRYFIRYTKPLFSDHNQDYGLTTFEEINYNLNNVGANSISGWDRNRFFIGPYISNQNLRLEIGYLHEIIRNSQGWSRNNHVLLMVLGFVF